jgi:hypothetical protein
LKITKNIQGVLVAGAFLATLIVLFGGRALAMKFRVDNPLNQHIKTVKAVRSFKVEPVGEGLQLDVALRQNSNLQMTLEAIVKEVEFYHKKTVTAIVIADRANDRLEQIRYQLSFYLEEALASGHFIQLKKALDVCGAQNGITAKVYLTPKFIYLQLETGTAYLYQAISRPEYPVVARNRQLEGGGAG